MLPLFIKPAEPPQPRAGGAGRESIRMSHFPGLFYPAARMTRLRKHRRSSRTPGSPGGGARSLPGNVSLMSSCLKTRCVSRLGLRCSAAMRRAVEMNGMSPNKSLDFRGASCTRGAGCLGSSSGNKPGGGAHRRPGPPAPSPAPQESPLLILAGPSLIPPERGVCGLDFPDDLGLRSWFPPCVWSGEGRRVR